MNLNTCDKCGKEEYSNYLIWITAEDFTPLKGEKLPDDIDKYDALCETCYQSELIN